MAQTDDITVYSPRADSVDVTIYRDGLALITETRTVSLPAEAATFVIEGVADTLLPESAVIADLDRPLVETNFDAAWLDPRSLLERSIGKTVTLARTDPASGRATRTTATIAAVNAGVVLETDDGFDALYCSGLPERLELDSVPDGLLAAPRLSVRIAGGTPGPRTVKVSYLATGFAWSADYVARLDASGDGMNLTGWATLVNDTGVAFHQAQVQLVAGSLNVTPETRRGGRSANTERTSASDAPDTLTPEMLRALPLTTCYAVPAPRRRRMGLMYASDAVAGTVNVVLDEIVVTGSRIMSREVLGDYQLYRLPWPTDLGAQQTKQVLFLDKPDVPVERYYAVLTEGLDTDMPFDEPLLAPTVHLRFRNTMDDGLGEPLPSGIVRVFEPYADTQVFAGERRIRDVPVGLPVEIAIGRAAGLFVEADWAMEVVEKRTGELFRRDMQYRLVNTKPAPVALEVRQYGGDLITDVRIRNASHRPRREGDEFVFELELAPGEERQLSYRLSGFDPD